MAVFTIPQEQEKIAKSCRSAYVRRHYGTAQTQDL